MKPSDVPLGLGAIPPVASLEYFQNVPRCTSQVRCCPSDVPLVYLQLGLNSFLQDGTTLTTASLSSAVVHRTLSTPLRGLLAVRILPGSSPDPLEDLSPSPLAPSARDPETRGVSGRIAGLAARRFGPDGRSGAVGVGLHGGDF